MFESIKKMFGLGKFSKKKKLADDTSHDISKAIGNHEGFIEDMNFDFVHKEFVRLIKGGTINRALPLLILMAKKAKTKEEHRTFMIHITSNVLSGVFWKNVDRNTTEGIIDICKTAGCLIGFWINDSDGQKKAENLLKVFTKSVDKKDENKEKKIEKFSDRLSNIESIIALSKDSSLSDEERALLAEYLALSTEVNSVKLKGSVFSQGPAVIESLLKDKPTNKEELEATKEFRAKVVKEIPKKKCTHNEVKFYVQKFISWFGDNILQDMIDGIQNKQIIGKISVSHESEEALNAFNKFFSENLDDVLTVLDDSKKVSHKLVA